MVVRWGGATGPLQRLKGSGEKWPRRSTRIRRLHEAPRELLMTSRSSRPGAIRPARSRRREAGLEEWRRTVSKPSPKLDEYTGDLAFEQHDPAGAARLGRKCSAPNPKTPAFSKKSLGRRKSNNIGLKKTRLGPLTSKVQDSAMARVNRALCRRRLHRWQDAFEDLKRAAGTGAG